MEKGKAIRPSLLHVRSRSPFGRLRLGCFADKSACTSDTTYRSIHWRRITTLKEGAHRARLANCGKVSPARVQPANSGLPKRVLRSEPHQAKDTFVSGGLIGRKLATSYPSRDCEESPLG